MSTRELLRDRNIDLQTTGGAIIHQAADQSNKLYRFTIPAPAGELEGIQLQGTITCNLNTRCAEHHSLNYHGEVEYSVVDTTTGDTIYRRSWTRQSTIPSFDRRDCNSDSVYLPLPIWVTLAPVDDVTLDLADLEFRLEINDIIDDCGRSLLDKDVGGTLLLGAQYSVVTE